MMDMCGDNRFEVIERAKEHLLDATNIETSEEEMAVLDNFLFRCWQMGWLDKYGDSKPKTGEWIPVSERLPKKEKKTYWVCTDTEYQCECRWTNNRFGIGEGEWGWSIFDTPQYSKPIAWMPLPEPYKAESEDEE